MVYRVVAELQTTWHIFSLPYIFFLKVSSPIFSCRNEAHEYFTLSRIMSTVCLSESCYFTSKTHDQGLMILQFIYITRGGVIHLYLVGLIGNSIFAGDLLGSNGIAWYHCSTEIINWCNCYRKLLDTKCKSLLPAGLLSTAWLKPCNYIFFDCHNIIIRILFETVLDVLFCKDASCFGPNHGPAFARGCVENRTMQTTVFGDRWDDRFAKGSRLGTKSMAIMRYMYTTQKMI